MFCSASKAYQYLLLSLIKLLSSCLSLFFKCLDNLLCVCMGEREKKQWLRDLFQQLQDDLLCTSIQSHETNDQYYKTAKKVATV